MLEFQRLARLAGIGPQVDDVAIHLDRDGPGLRAVAIACRDRSEHRPRLVSELRHGIGGSRAGSPEYIAVQPDDGLAEFGPVQPRRGWILRSRAAQENRAAEEGGDVRS